ncbi:hypothetical protein [Robbsia andropogonis]|uniref:hypothetical protein n=1 Tax=Robbsia andropogonis TaxID=28092 RepID=UPI000465598D|nr:hypothetical protein [Robbsia andropogonis]
MNEDVIREFMVRIGYQTDETSLKKFRASLEGITKVVLTLGAAVAATAGAVIAGVKILSSQMESLYYSSKRTGETVGNIMALRSAASQIGLTADQAQSSLEGFVQSLRMNPGKAGLLAELGVTGNTPLEQYDNFIEKTKSMAPYVAAAYAQLFGIDPATLQMQQIGHEKALAAEAAYRQKLLAFHIDPERAAEAGTSFNNSIRRLTDDVHLFWVLLQEHLAPVLDTIVSKFEKWELGHADQVAWKIASALEAVAKWVGEINWDKVGSNVDKFLDRAAKVGAAVAKVVDWLGGGDGKPSPEAGAPKTGNKLIDWLNHPLGQITRNRPEEAAKNPESDVSAEAPPDRGSFLAWLFGSVDHKQHGIAGYDPQGFGQIDDLQAQSKDPRGIRNNNPGNIKYGAFAKDAGAVGQDRGGFAIFPEMKAGVEATIKLLQGYAKRGIDTVEKVISRWAPPSENNTSAYIADVAKSLGVSADQRLTSDQIASLAPAIFKHEGNGGYLGRMQNARLGSDGPGVATPLPNISQNTTVNVHGSADPVGTGRSVANEQARVNADMTRNFMVAVR